MQMTPLWWLLYHTQALALLSLKRDLGKVCEWCDLWWPLVNCVTINASPVTPINYWQNCVGGIWWPWYIGSDIWFQDYFWEVSSLGFQSSFSMAWHLEVVLASVYNDRLLLERCFRGFVLPVLEVCSALWCSDADTHHMHPLCFKCSALAVHPSVYIWASSMQNFAGRTFISPSVSMWNDLETLETFIATVFQYNTM